MNHIDAFFEFCRLRYSIYLKKTAGEPKPWTEDPILQNYRFCNIFREDDAVTVWFRENVRERQRNDDIVAFSTAAFRLFNNIPVGTLLNDAGLLDNWDKELAIKTIGDVAPAVSPAYIVTSPKGYSKARGLIEVVDNYWQQKDELANDLSELTTLEEGHKRVCDLWFVGPFIGYEIITDLRHTKFFENAPDIMTWANPGPGCAKGLNWIFGGEDVDHKMPVKDMFPALIELLEYSRDEKYWPKDWPVWEARDAEHATCEYRKYVHAKFLGKRMKRKFDGKGL